MKLQFYVAEICEADPGVLVITAFIFGLFYSLKYPL
jgi:hypothetical protein